MHLIREAYLRPRLSCAETKDAAFKFLTPLLTFSYVNDHCPSVTKDNAGERIFSDLTQL